MNNQSSVIPPSRWFTVLNDEQRNNAQRKFQETRVPSVHNPASDVIQEPDKGSVSASDEDTTVDITNTQNLSVDVETVCLNTGIPTLVLRKMWVKAIELLNTNQVLSAPECVTSSHTVQLNSNLTLVFDHSLCLLILFESRTNDCVFFGSNSCGITNLTRNWWKLNLYMNLLTSPTEEIQEQDSIAGTQDFPIKASLYKDININRLQNGGVTWVTNFRALSRYMYYIAN